MIWLERLTDEWRDGETVGIHGTQRQHKSRQDDEFVQDDGRNVRKYEGYVRANVGMARWIPRMKIMQERMNNIEHMMGTIEKE